jgi:DNA-binding GntR family transcriptional regulator
MAPETRYRQGAARLIARDPESLADKVFLWVTAQLVEGTLRPGQWISENELVAILGVSRAPIREALQSLAREGVVHVRPRRGTIIAELSAEEGDDLYRAREVVDGELVLLAITHADDTVVARLDTVAAAFRDAIGDRSAFFEATRDWWTVLIDACPNRVIGHVAAGLWRRAILYRSVLLGLQRLQQESADCAAFHAACARSNDGAAAREATVAMFGSIRAALRNDVFMDHGVARPVG